MVDIKNEWSNKELIEVCKEITDGSHFSPKSSPDYSYPYITVRDLDQGEIDFINCKFVDSNDYKKLLNNGCKPNKGDLLFSKDGTVGKVALVSMEKEFVVLSSLAIIRPKNELIESELLEYILRHPDFLKTAIGKKTGVAIRRIILKNLKSINIQFPKSLTEQKQIVALLDQAFTAIDQAIANLEKNIQNAQELFQSKLNDVFSQRGEGWVERSLGEVCEVKDGTHSSPKYVDPKEGIPFVTQKNILKTGLSFENTKFINQVDHDDFYRRSNVAYNDILFSMIGANRGMVCIVNDKRVFSIKNVGLIKSSTNIDSKFLLYYLKSPIALSYVANNSSGSAQGFIGLTKLRAFPTPYPNIKEQKQIITILDGINTRTLNLIKTYKNKLNSLEELKKSILQKAFNGELT